MAQSILAEIRREHITFEYVEGQEGPTITPPDDFSVARFDKLVDLEEQHRPVLQALLSEQDNGQISHVGDEWDIIL
jgi:hypothetical protein